MMQKKMTNIFRCTYVIKSYKKNYIYFQKYYKQFILLLKFTLTNVNLQMILKRK